MQMYTDPKGEAYRQVIDLAIRNSEFFILGEKYHEDLEPGPYAHVLEALEPYLDKRIVIESHHLTQDVMALRNIYRSHAFYAAGTYYFFRCCEESGAVLKQMANRLADWVYPRLPEDLCFLKADGEDYLYSVVHEEMYGMEVTAEEAIALMDRITGLFLKVDAHRDLDRLLDDAIKHQTDKLSISGHRLTELPQRIRELSELRELQIFEQDLCRLPEGLFELSKLERLCIMTAELENIPASIGKLSNLRQLTIGCGSSDRPVPGWKPKPKEAISLNRIPPEIGELEKLEHLSIRYTSIHELPLELEKLKQMRTLIISNCMIKQKPAFLRRMKLQHLTVSPNFY
ncbi:hypothetical protein FHS18_006450 [Paenibacillus phyllosphaerae]|uniref:Leucine-rich repeat domain-containing protein n=1 Tax=Paenibacillus phyllosphaerae TaxID=274593 RepID=A0A7W5FRT0_9BACL|nr:leucine-rich repeat domain-containing protein [Paenibacillus phyllosphaerae]MBB3114329.1 hypothetical protein [Paenibacillus phyllosphaerae]